MSCVGSGFVLPYLYHYTHFRYSHRTILWTTYCPDLYYCLLVCYGIVDAFQSYNVFLILFIAWVVLCVGFGFVLPYLYHYTHFRYSYRTILWTTYCPDLYYCLLVCYGIIDAFQSYNVFLILFIARVVLVLVLSYPAYTTIPIFAIVTVLSCEPLTALTSTIAC